MSHTLSNNVHHGGSHERNIQTRMLDRRVEYHAPNVDLMTGLYEMKERVEDDGGRQKSGEKTVPL